MVQTSALCAITVLLAAGSSAPAAIHVSVGDIVAREEVEYERGRHKEAHESAAVREALFRGWGECRYGNTIPKPRARRTDTTKRNLLVVNALGNSLVRLYNVERNVVRHFDTHKEGGSWDCLVNVYGDLSNSLMSCLTQHCEVQRQHNFWGAFLLTVTPTLTQHYAHVALLLDDVWLPDYYNLAHDIIAMETHKLDVMSPSVHGSHHATTKVTKPLEKACLWSWPSEEPRLLEFFFTIFTANAWSCFYHSVLQKRTRTSVEGQHQPEGVFGNPGGCGYDVCLPVLCPKLKYGLESRSEVFHIKSFYHRGKNVLWSNGTKEVVSSGFGVNMAAHKRDFVERTPNECNWQISVGNCTVRAVSNMMKDVEGRVPLICNA